VGLELPILAKIQQRDNVAENSAPDYAVSRVKDFLLTLLHLAVLTAKLCAPGGVRAVIAENLLLKQQLIVLRRARKRAPNLSPSDRLLCGFWSLFLSPGRIRKAAIAFRPSTILGFHQALVRRKYRQLFSSTPRCGRTRATRRRRMPVSSRGIVALLTRICIISHADMHANHPDSR